MSGLCRLPDVLILNAASTGLGILRGMAEADVNITALIFDKNEPIQFSRHCRVELVQELADDENALVDWLCRRGQNHHVKTVLLPSCDKFALFIAKYAERLSPYYYIWKNSYQTMLDIIEKGKLYSNLSETSVNIIPFVNAPNSEQLSNWLQQNAAPFIVKPDYQGAEKSALKIKNARFASAQALSAFLSQNSSNALVVQRLLRGGDGYIFDCYGYVDARGKILTLSTHRRLRQHAPDFGATTLGEIPASISDEMAANIVEGTRKVIAKTGYHGIFGIEWLLERESGTFYIIDFNARPFSTIGHLTSCGVNLPLIAYFDLTGLAPRADLITPLRHKLWIDFYRDCWSFRQKKANHEITYREWIISLLRCRSFAYWKWSDPGPGLYQGWVVLSAFIKGIGKLFIKPERTTSD